MSGERDEIVRQIRQAAEAQGFELLEGDYVLRDGSHSGFYLKPKDAARISRVVASLLNPKERW